MLWTWNRCNINTPTEYQYYNYNLFNLILFKSDYESEAERFSVIWIIKTIVRLNSDDFSKFFLYLGILFLTYSHESTQLEMQKNTVFSNLLYNIHHFRGFSDKTYFWSEIQSRAMLHSLCTIEFLIKFHNEWPSCGNWARMSENDFTKNDF